MHGRPFFFVLCLVAVACPLSAAAGFRKESQGPAFDGRTAAEWLERASEQMNIRMPGSAPFHLKVAFHAYPGWEVLGPKEKPQVITGDGTYEETWLAPHKWRREVTLGDYHAIEVESDKGRKMQASSDYEPSRVLMLLTTLYEPALRWLLPGESGIYRTEKWSIGPVSVAGVPLVELRSSFSMTERSPFIVHNEFYFLPEGALVLEKTAGILTSWLNDVSFSGKIVPRKITIEAPGQKPGSSSRDLLTASVTINPAGPTLPAAFDLPGPPASPASTLRPLLDRVDELPRILNQPPPLHHDERVQMMGTVDRNGTVHELEVIEVENAIDLYQIVLEGKSMKYVPAEIDGSPCEVALPLNIMIENHTDY